MIKIIYAVLLGVILALFIGLGIEAFYPTEKYPETPAALELQYAKSDISDPSAEQIKLQEDYNQVTKDYNTRNAKHARNVSMFAIAGSIILMALSLTIFSRKEVFSNGFLLGSLFTLMYGIMRGFESDDTKFRFIIVTIGLAVAMVLGYFKFLKHEEEKTK